MTEFINDDLGDFGATFSQSRKYRFALWRIWDRKLPLVMFIGLNPSTANETNSDPTIRSVGRISKANGFGGFYMMNCFPLVSTDPKALKPFYLSANSFEQSQYSRNHEMLQSVSLKCHEVVFAWGNFPLVKELGIAEKYLLNMFPNAKALSLNKNGSPKHPLYCKSDTKFIPYHKTV